MRHNHNVLNILLPTIILGSYFSYCRVSLNRLHYNLENHSLLLNLPTKYNNYNNYNMIRYTRSLSTVPSIPKYMQNNYNFYPIYAKR